MPPLVSHLWLIPALPLVAAGLGALTPRAGRAFAAGTALAGPRRLARPFGRRPVPGPRARPAQHLYANFSWFELGAGTVRLGWLLDPLTAFMAVMVCFVGLLIFIFSLGYMREDANFTRFFCFLSLFAAAMLGVLVANSLLLLFVCWELVGLASYLLIGFWFHKPEAAAAAKKAFITTRIGDLGFLLGLVWLYDASGTLLFFDGGRGCLEASALQGLAGATAGGLAVSTAIGLLIFCGAVGKSGQFPLHVWLPDAMEGPTPVSALIHAATMVAAGVFLIARVLPAGRRGPGAGGRTAPCADRGRLHRRDHGPPRRGHRGRAARPEARARLFDHLAAGLHDARPGRGLLGGGDLPPADPRLLQGPALPRAPARSSPRRTTSRTSAGSADSAPGCA